MSIVDDIKLALKFLKFRAFMSVMTIISVALGVALIIWLQNLTAGVRDAFINHATPYNLVVGPSGSPVQLILNSLFYLDKPVGKVTEDMYRELKNDPMIDRAVPIAMGDSYRGIPVVGTTGEYFTPLPGEKHPLSLRAGRIFDTELEAVVGAEASRQTGLLPGAAFHTAHGLSGSESHADIFTVVGILASTGGPRDRAIYCSVKSIHDIHGNREDKPAYSAILVRPRHLTYLPLLQRNLQVEHKVQAVFPAAALFQLFEVFDIWKKIIEVLCWIVVLVALGSISIALYSFVQERKGEIALMRALGASRRRVIRFVLLQSEILAIAGGLAGVVAGHALMFILSGAVQSYTGIELPMGIHTLWEVYIITALIITGGIFGLIPAVKAYQVSIGDNLA